MDVKQVIYQRPAIKIIVKDAQTGAIVTSRASGQELVFGPGANTAVLSYSFSLSINDISGSFSVTFYPDYTDGAI